MVSDCRAFTSSALRFSWSVSLVGAQQIATLLSAPRASGTSLDRISEAAVATMGETLGRVYRVGDGIQRGAVDGAFDALDPRWALDLADRAGRGASVVAAGAGGAALVEIRNKLEVFFLVRGVARRIGVPEDGPLPLRELVQRCYALGDFAALWAVEGLGHEYADRFWKRRLEPRDLLTQGPAGDLPARSLLMLHAGMGLSFAQRRLGALKPTSSRSDLESAVEEVLALCRRNSRSGYTGAAIESLGLVARTFHAEQVTLIDELLRGPGRDEDRGFFWHGVGRAIYFLPINFLPCSVASVFAMARREAPDELARRSACAGLAWAFLLVNERQPEILAELLIGPYGQDLARDDAFANGIASATVMRADTTPATPLLRGLFDYGPPGSLAPRWDALVREPVRRAVESYQSYLAGEGHLDEVFRYQDLGALVNRQTGRRT